MGRHNMTFQTPAILLFLLSVAVSSAWDNEELELFDLVEEINQNFYELFGVDQVKFWKAVNHSRNRLFGVDQVKFSEAVNHSRNRKSSLRWWRNWLKCSSGQLKSSPAAVASEDSNVFFSYAVLASVLVSLLAVVISYSSKVQGDCLFYRTRLVQIRHQPKALFSMHTTTLSPLLELVIAIFNEN